MKALLQILTGDGRAGIIDLETGTELHLCAGELLSEYYVGNLDQAQFLFKTKFRTTSSKNQMEFTRLFSAAKV